MQKEEDDIFEFVAEDEGETIKEVKDKEGEGEIYIDEDHNQNEQQKKEIKENEEKSYHIKFKENENKEEIKEVSNNNSEAIPIDNLEVATVEVDNNKIVSVELENNKLQTTNENANNEQNNLNKEEVKEKIIEEFNTNKDDKTSNNNIQTIINEDNINLYNDEKIEDNNKTISKSEDNFKELRKNIEQHIEEIQEFSEENIKNDKQKSLNVNESNKEEAIKNDQQESSKVNDTKKEEAINNDKQESVNEIETKTDEHIKNYQQESLKVNEIKDEHIKNEPIEHIIENEAIKEENNIDQPQELPDNKNEKDLLIEENNIDQPQELPDNKNEKDLLIEENNIDQPQELPDNKNKFEVKLEENNSDQPQEIPDNKFEIETRIEPPGKKLDLIETVSSPEKKGEENKNENEDVFNFIEDENNDHPANINKSKDNITVNHNEFNDDLKLENEEFNFAEGDTEHKDLTPLESNDNQVLNEANYDEFNFVDEEPTQTENADEIKVDTQPKQSLNAEPKEEDDDFNFVDEEPEQKNATIITETPHLSKSNEKKNTTLINDLLLNYSDKYINKDISTFNEESKDPNIPVNELTNFFVNIDKANTSFNKIIQNMSLPQTESEIQIRTLTVEEMIKMSKSHGLSNVNKKISPFHKAVSETSNKIIKSLYFKFIDLKDIYVNSIQIFSGVRNSNNLDMYSPHLKKKESEIQKEINFSSELKQVDELPGSNDLNTKKEDVFEFVEEVEDNKTNIEINKVEKSSEIKQKSARKLNKMIQEDSDDEFGEVEEFEVKTKKIEINKELYSIVMDTNLNPESFAKEKENNPADDKTEECIIPNTFDELKMIEMLKNISKKDEDKPINQSIQKSEDEINQEAFEKIIQSLPNYHFMVSKFVEYPDTFFNLN